MERFSLRTTASRTSWTSIHALRCSPAARAARADGLQEWLRPRAVRSVPVLAAAPDVYLLALAVSYERRVPLVTIEEARRHPLHRASSEHDRPVLVLPAGADHVGGRAAGRGRRLLDADAIREGNERKPEPRRAYLNLVAAILPEVAASADPRRPRNPFAFSRAAESSRRRGRPRRRDVPPAAPISSTSCGRVAAARRLRDHHRSDSQVAVGYDGELLIGSGVRTRPRVHL